MSLRSMLGLGGGLEETFPPEGATHVLYFAPAGCGDAAWLLVSVADWCGGQPPLQWTFLGEMLPDFDSAGQPCAEFAAETLGYPVTLAEFGYCGASRWKAEQAFWITPAA